MKKVVVNSLDVLLLLVTVPAYVSLFLALYTAYLTPAEVAADPSLPHTVIEYLKTLLPTVMVVAGVITLDELEH